MLVVIKHTFNVYLHMILSNDNLLKTSTLRVKKCKHHQNQAQAGDSMLLEHHFGVGSSRWVLFLHLMN